MLPTLQISFPEENAILHFLFRSLNNGVKVLKAQPGAIHVLLFHIRRLPLLVRIN